MGRGLSSPITTALAGVAFDIPIYGVRVTVSPSQIYRWGEAGFTLGAETFEARLMSIDGIQFTADNAQEATFIVANVDGSITTLDQTLSFLGAKVEVIAFMPALNESYNIWTGWSDELQSVDAVSASFIIYPITAVPGILLPRRSIGIPCTNTFGNTANWNSVRDFEGSECPYQRVSTIGFTATISSLFGPVAVATWTSGQVAAGAFFQKGDKIKVRTEKMMIVDATAPNGSFQQSIVLTRAIDGTSIDGSIVNGDIIFFANCGFGVADCIRRGMYGNNSSDTYTA